LSVAHSSNAYMRNYRKLQGEKDQRKDDWISMARDALELQLYRDYINERILHGCTEEQAVDSLIQTITPPEEYQTEETGSSCVAADAIPKTKPDCFGKQLHKDSEPCDCSFRKECDRAWMVEYLKKPAQKDVERRQKIIDILAKSKDLVEGIERRERAELWVKVQAQNDVEQKEFDVCVKKYVDQGVSEKTAIENAEWDRKRQNAEKARQYRELAGKRELMTDEDKTAEKLRLLKASEKLRGDSEC